MVIHLCSGLFGRQSNRLGSNLIFCLMVVPMSDEFSKVSQCFLELISCSEQLGLGQWFAWQSRSWCLCRVCLGSFYAGPGLTSVHTELGVALFQLSSRHDFSHTLQLSDSLFLGSSGQEGEVLPESQPPKLSCSFAQLELPSRRGSKRKKPTFSPRSSNKSASLSPVSLSRERGFIGVLDACAVPSAILKLDLSSEPSWEGNKRGKMGGKERGKKGGKGGKREKEDLLHSVRTGNSFAQSSGWKEGVSLGVFVVSACCTVPGFSSHSGRIQVKKKTEVHEPNPLWIFIQVFTLVHNLPAVCTFQSAQVVTFFIFYSEFLVVISDNDRLQLAFSILPGTGNSLQIISVPIFFHKNIL